MLKELRIVYEDDTKYTKIVHHTKATIKPIRDKIRHCECGPFKYKVEKHHYLPVSIIRFGNKSMIYPAGIPCIPETTLDDIEVIESNKPKVVVEKPHDPFKPSPHKQPKPKAEKKETKEAVMDAPAKPREKPTVKPGTKTPPKPKPFDPFKPDPNKQPAPKAGTKKLPEWLSFKSMGIKLK